MKTSTLTPCLSGNQFSLKETISHLLKSYQPVAEKQQSYFINDTQADLAVEADKNIFSTLLGSILYLTARCSHNSCIRISANEHYNVITLCVKNTDTPSDYSVFAGMQHLQLLAEKLGAVINMLPGKNAGGFIFSFPATKAKYKYPENMIKIA